MRTSLAPNRNIHTQKSPPPPLLSLAVVTYCGTELWYRDRAAIMRICLDSLVRGAGKDYELIIWNNGGPAEYAELLKSYRPTVYIESKNIGGYNGRRAMLGIARGEYTCITDDDVLFSDRWYIEQMKIYNQFKPAAVSVSGYAKPNKGRVGALKNLPGCWVRMGQFIPQPWIKDLNTSIGIVNGSTSRGTDVMARRNGVEAWVVDADMQMLGKTDALRELHAPYCEYLGTSGYLCDRIHATGMVQLATLQRTAVHIGNRIDETVVNMQRELSGENPLPKIVPVNGTWIVQND